MEDANGYHSGDHAGNYHWKNKKIINAGCESCAPVSGFSNNFNLYFFIVYNLYENRKASSGGCACPDC